MPLRQTECGGEMGEEKQSASGTVDGSGTDDPTTVRNRLMWVTCAAMMGHGDVGESCSWSPC